MSGWIKLHRALKEWQWYDDHNATRLLIHLLVSVNYEDKKWKGCTIQAGSMAYSWDTLSNAIGLSVQQTRTAMDKLKSSSEVTIKTTNKYQVLTLCKWGELQDTNKQTTSNLTDKEQANNKQITTTKERKEIKESKEVRKRESFSPPQLIEIEDYFLKKNVANFKLEGAKFFNYYESNGWKVGKNKMKKWESAASGWITRINNFKTNQNGSTESKGDKYIADLTKLGSSIVD